MQHQGFHEGGGTVARQLDATDGRRSVGLSAVSTALNASKPMPHHENSGEPRDDYANFAAVAFGASATVGIHAT